jgi:hypothetical protein
MDEITRLKKEMKIIMLVCATVSAGLTLFFAECSITNSTQTSRLATIESLVTNRSFTIDTTKEFWPSRDIAMMNGHYYSPKPPLLAVIGAAAYKAYTHVRPISFKNKTETIIFFSVMIGFLPHLLLLMYFYMFLEIWVDDPVARAWAFACISLGYLGTGYAATMNNHTPTAAFILAAFYHAYTIRSGRSGAFWHYLLVGFFSSLAGMIDIPSSVFMAALFVYLVTYNPVKTMLFFVPAALPCVVFTALVDKSISGTIMPLQSISKAFKFEGSYWKRPDGIDALDESKLLYAFNILFGHHGFFIMTPILLFGFNEAVKCFRRKDFYWREAALVLGPTLILIVFYIFYTKNYGGYNVGFRWLIPAMPPLILFTARWLNKTPPTRWMIVFVFMLLISGLNMIDALQYAWKEPSRWANLVYTIQPLSQPVYWH